MTSDVAFELRSQDLLQLARRRGRRGAWLFGFSIFGLLFGTFWMFWGVIVFLTGVGLVNGVIVFLFGGVGPTLGASLVAWAGVRRRRDAEELEQLAILAETRGDVTLGEAAHLLSESEAHAAKLLNVASSAGAARMVQSSALRAPLPLGPERQNLSAFRKARRRRALLLGVAALGVLGFATLWLVVGIAGIATGEWVVGLILLIPGGLFPLAGSLVLARRALGNWRRAARAGRLSTLVTSSSVRTLDDLAARLALSLRDAESVAVEALELGIVPQAALARILSPAAAAPAPPALAQPLSVEGFVGQVLGGSYRLDALVAQGGMGAVFRATHLPSGSVYAVKLMLPEVAATADGLARFEREALAAGKLGHPGIVRVHELGRVDARTAYLVMDLLEGETLEARLQRVGTLGWRDALAISAQIGDALSAAHSAGLLHRDLKPANVFLARTPTGERAMLLDFGLAKALDATEASRRTVSGIVAGTPLYMSPEQARGEPLDVRSDLYGLAVVTYEMIAGVPPFFDKTLAEVYARLLREAAPALGSVCPGASPPALEQVLARALSSSRADRPAAVSAFLEELSQVAHAAAAQAG
ncbi:MAG: serine/threonine protein kinase [Myxococcales bacterium]|nr:serine/threonine protein kinase [Myxococcales bacterium]